MLQRLTRFFRRHPSPDPDRDLISVLDIGTELVKVLIAKRTGREMAIVGTGTCRQTLRDMAAGTVLDIEGVAENCQEALREAEREAGVAPSRVIIGLAGELVRSVGSHIRHTRTEPDREITEDELQRMVEKVQWEAFEDIRAQVSDAEGEACPDIKLIHSAITGVMIDGHEVASPLKFTGTELDVTVFNVFAPLVQYRSIETVARLIGRQVLMVACEPYAVSRCLGFDDGSDVSALFVDIGGGTTDVALVTRGSIRSTAMFGMGGRAFTRSIARASDLPHREAEAAKLGRRPLPTPAAKAIREATEAWIEGLRISIAQLQEDVPRPNPDSDTAALPITPLLPSRLFLCGGGSLLPEISQALGESDWWQDIGFSKRPRVTHLYPRDVANVSDCTGRLASPQDVTPMALANLALELTVHETLLSRMLRKASRLVER